MRLLFVLFVFLSGNIFAQKPALVIPFDLDGNMIIIKLKVNGSISGNFLFDTGGSLWLDRGFVTKNNLKTEGEHNRIYINGIGDGGGDSVEIIKNLELSVNDTKFVAKQCHVSHLPIGSSKFDGIIGFEFFSNKILEINFGEKTITAHNIVPKHIDNTYSIIKSLSKQLKDNLSNRRLYIAMDFQIDSTTQLSGFGFFDTGSPELFTFNTNVASNINAFNQKEPIVELQRTGAFGKGVSTTAYHTVKSIKIGDKEFNNVLITYSKDKKGSFNQTVNPRVKVSDAGIMGMGLIKQFNWIIDLKNHKVYAKPNMLYATDKSLSPNTISLATIRFGFTPNKVLMVSGVLSNQPDLNGINVYDTVSKITKLNNNELITDIAIPDSLPKYYNIPLSVTLLKNNTAVEKQITIKRKTFSVK